MCHQAGQPASNANCAGADAVLCCAVLYRALLCCAVLCVTPELHALHAQSVHALPLNANNVSHYQLLLLGCLGTSGEVQWHPCVSEF